MLLGSGELGKEVVIALQRLGQHVIAVDAYPGAPAMQVADGFEVISMLDGEALDAIVDNERNFVFIEYPDEASLPPEFFAWGRRGRCAARLNSWCLRLARG